MQTAMDHPVTCILDIVWFFALKEFTIYSFDMLGFFAFVSVYLINFFVSLCPMHTIAELFVKYIFLSTFFNRMNDNSL